MEIETVIWNLTLEEKAALLTGKNEWQTLDLPQKGIESLCFSDGPSGIRKQEGEGDHLGLNPSIVATCFPAPSLLANSWDEQMEENIGAAMGEEARMAGVSVLLGPGLNLKRNPLCGRNFEYFSEDPYLSGKMAAALVRGVQSIGVAACIKHFALNQQETRRMVLDAVSDERTLRELYLTAFEIAVKEGKPGAVMSAYNKINGCYANENRHLLIEILRKEWGFDGIVVTDWGGGNDYVEGIRNGSNIQMPGCGLESAGELVQAVQEGRIPEKEVDARVEELLKTIVKYGGRTYSGADKWKLFAQNHTLARKAAAESMVLLKNENQCLPVKSNQKVALIGDFAFDPRYQGEGSSRINAAKVENAVQLAENYAWNIVGSARGYRRDGAQDMKLQREALELAGRADVVFYFFGLTEQSESEGVDRRDLCIPENQVKLLEKLAEANPHVVGILCAGGVVDTQWRDSCEAILLAGLSGQAGASAILEILAGKVNPGGRLNESFPCSYTDEPSAEYYPARGNCLEYRESLYVGYRYYDTSGVQVAFPFGYGLSYTTFEIGDLAVDDKGIQLWVKNTGTLQGTEVVQMYVSLPQAKVFRPARELKGFLKTELEPGERKEIQIPFDDKTFRYWNRRTGHWEVESGVYEILVKIGSNETVLEGKIEIRGTDAKIPYDPDRLPSYYKVEVHKISDAEYAELLGFVPPTDEESQYLGRNDPLCAMHRAANPLARKLCRQLEKKLDRAEEMGVPPDLNTLFQYNMPFRAIAKMTEGQVSMGMVDGLLLMVNGHSFRGLAQVVKEFFRNWHSNRKYGKLLRYGATQEQDGRNEWK